jgi:uncharacterized Fe-S cluster-containing radical SAM superfamily protein
MRRGGSSAITMAYRIQYQAQGGFLSAVVSGKSRYAARIARDRYYGFAEMVAKSLGCSLRCFADPAAAIRWLSRK